MSDLRKAAEMALEALKEVNKLSVGEIAVCLPAEIDDAMEALRQALAQPVDAVNMSQERVDETAKGEHEPVAFVNGYFGGYLSITCFDPTLILPDGLTLYTAPPKREWVGLTDDELEDLEFASVDREYGHLDVRVLSRAIEAKLKEKSE